MKKVILILFCIPIFIYGQIDTNFSIKNVSKDIVLLASKNEGWANRNAQLTILDSMINYSDSVLIQVEHGQGVVGMFNLIKEANIDTSSFDGEFELVTDNKQIILINLSYLAPFMNEIEQDFWVEFFKKYHHKIKNDGKIKFVSCGITNERYFSLSSKVLKIYLELNSGIERKIKQTGKIGKKILKLIHSEKINYRKAVDMESYISQINFKEFSHCKYGRSFYLILTQNLRDIKENELNLSSWEVYRDSKIYKNIIKNIKNIQNVRNYTSIGILHKVHLTQDVREYDSVFELIQKNKMVSSSAFILDFKTMNFNYHVDKSGNLYKLIETNEKKR